MATAQASSPPFTSALLAGGIAGTTVDLALFPLDTLKTRLQSSEGFFASGGFRGIYRGVGSAALGSAPGAALFFCTYESAKTFCADLRRGTTTARERGSLQQQGEEGENGLLGLGNAKSHAVDHMFAASLGEIAACAVRVPTEVVKQRAQAGQHGGSSLSSLRAILALRHHQPSSSSSSSSGSGLLRVVRELYRGWGITVLREVPFTIIQFPIWESLKAYSRRRQQLLGPGEDVSAAESALYGSVAGAVAAAVTTPLDVLKTRVMLSSQRTGVAEIVVSILRQHGIRPFFAGIGPRVMWISVGGAVFLGSYQWAVNALERGRVRRGAGLGLP